MRYFLPTIALLTLLVPACAATTLPQQQLMDTQAAITTAEELDAAQNADAKLHLQFANDQLEAAKKLMEDGDDDEARRMLDRASADADLALTLARTVEVHDASKAARAEVTELRTGETAPPAAITK
jgi:hypothetical protein